MIRANATLAFALAGIIVMPLQSSAADRTGKPVRTEMVVALDVDRDGHVAAATYVAGNKLPDAIWQRAEQVARGWKFLPPMKDGKAVGGRTYAVMQACIMPRGDSVDLSFTHIVNGPASIYRARRKRKSAVLAIPTARLMDQGINDLQGNIVYVVSADGKATLESATLDDPGLQEQYGRHWRAHQHEALKDYRYHPEIIDGVPTTTRVETMVGMEWGKPSDLKKVIDAERDATCKARQNDSDPGIASDSPFKRTGG